MGWGTPKKELSEKEYNIQTGILYATVILAVCALIGSIVSIYSTYKQSEYHKKTTRPYVHVDSLDVRVEYADSLIYVKYGISNIGLTPAKEVLKNSRFYDSDSLIVVYDSDSLIDVYKNIPDKTVSFGLFPNQFMILNYSHNPLTFKCVSENRFFHIFITYKDMSDNIYHYRCIFLISDFPDNIKYYFIRDYFD